MQVSDLITHLQTLPPHAELRWKGMFFGGPTESGGPRLDDFELRDGYLLIGSDAAQIDYGDAP